MVVEYDTKSPTAVSRLYQTDLYIFLVFREVDPKLSINGNTVVSIQGYLSPLPCVFIPHFVIYLSALSICKQTDDTCILYSSGL